MQNIRAEDYFKYIDSPIIFGRGDVNIPISKEEEKRYISFINNIAFDSPKKVQVSINQFSLSKQHNNKLINQFLLTAKNRYEKIYELDDGLNYIFAFKKFNPIEVQTILNWGNSSLTKSAENNNIFLRLLKNYQILSPATVLQENLDLAYGNTTLLKKIFGNKNTSDVKVNLLALKEQLNNIFNECEEHIDSFEESFNKLMFDTSVLSSIIITNDQLNEQDELDSFVLKTLQNRAMTLTDTLNSCSMIKPQLVALKESLVANMLNIDDAIVNTLPLIEFNRSRS